MNESQPPPNPYAAPVIVAEVAHDPHRPATETAQPPRIWTVFVGIALTFLAVIATQVVAVVLLLVWLFGGDLRPNAANELLDAIARPGPFMFLGLISQGTILAAALIAAAISPQPLRQRLGLVWPSLPLLHTAVAIFGVLMPFGLGLAAAYALAEVIPPDETVAKLYKNMTPAMALPFIAFIAVAPAFAEELLFRGYLQRRLLERWNPWVAVLVTSAIFAAFHIQPHAVVFAFPIGIWLGILAWRTGSVWPGIVCHAAINGLWNVYQIGAHFTGREDEVPWTLMGVLGVIGLAAFAWSVVLLRVSPPVPTTMDAL